MIKKLYTEGIGRVKTYLNKDFSSNVSIADIKRWFTDHNNIGPFFSMFETGLDRCRFDLIRIDPHRQYVRIFEFKSCRADFVSDKKWQKYLKYCHTFTFVCPKEVIKKEDLPAGIGLLWIYQWKWKESDKWLLDSEWVKRPQRREINQNTLLRLAFMIVSRVRWRKDDMF